MKQFDIRMSISGDNEELQSVLSFHYNNYLYNNYMNGLFKTKVLDGEIIVHTDPIEDYFEIEEFAKDIVQFVKDNNLGVKIKYRINKIETINKFEYEN